MYDEAGIFKGVGSLLRMRPELREVCRFGFVIIGVFLISNVLTASRI